MTGQKVKHATGIIELIAIEVCLHNVAVVLDTFSFRHMFFYLLYNSYIQMIIYCINECSTYSTLFLTQCFGQGFHSGSDQRPPLQGKGEFSPFLLGREEIISSILHVSAGR